MSWDFQKFKNKFYEITGLDLDSYKDRQMERRIRQRMDRYQLKSFEEFFDLLNRDQEVLYKFMDYLTINTSNFFRDRAVFENIRNHVLPELLAGNRRLKLWSMGCSSGEEPYTLALILARLGALTAPRYWPVISTNEHSKKRNKGYTNTARCPIYRVSYKTATFPGRENIILLPAG